MRTAADLGGGSGVYLDEIVRRRPRAELFLVDLPITLAMTPAGRTYTEEEILDWGRAAGFGPEPGERIDDRTRLVRLRRPTE